MKQSIWGSLVTATVSVAALGIAPGSATLPSEGDEVPRSRRSVQSVATHLQGALPPSSDAEATPQLADLSNPNLGSKLSTQDTARIYGDVSKVGEYQSDEAQNDGAIAIVTIYPHRLGDRPAATLQVRSIPVFTVVGDEEATPTPSTAELSVGMFSIESVELGSPALANAGNDIKLPSSDVKSQIAFADATWQQTSPSETLAAADSRVDPLPEASTIAARINQLHRDSVDAEQINVRWEGDRRTYVIHADGADIVELGDRVRLTDTTQDAAEDALQAANRLRRLLGGAAPLRTIEGQPQLVAQAQESGGLRGMASWYGPGFHGNRAASGEVFDQNEMTAAHRTLPFGTQVRVTNLNNGQSVVVRINDRGPFTGGRVIDLSAAAARAIGMLNSGVAPVRVEVMQ
jgi:rare lipoprotein A